MPQRRAGTTRKAGYWPFFVGLCLLTGSAPAGAQQVPPPPNDAPPVSAPPPPAAPLPAEGEPPAEPAIARDEGATIPAAEDPLEKVAPYNTWKHHEGEPQDSVVLLRSATGATFSGVVLRCDGFLLVPQSVYPEIDGRNRVEVAVAPKATEKDDTLMAPLPVVGRLRGAANYRAEFGLVKVNDHHLRCVRALSASVVQPGTPLRVVYAVPDPRDKARCVAVTWEATAGTDTAGDGVYWSLANCKPGDGTAPGAVPATLPAGAAVFDAESGGLVGIVTRPGAAPIFSSLARLNDLVSEVGVAPNRAAIKQVRSREAPNRIDGKNPGTGSWRQGEMVRVPGGPVLLVGQSAAQSKQVYGNMVACTPDFYIDVYPVSNKEYREWLRPHALFPSPFGWMANERFYPERRADLPATGMQLREAAMFARDRDARLVTEVEWLRAARLSASAVAFLESQYARNALIQANGQRAQEALRTFLRQVSLATAASYERALGRSSARVQLAGNEALTLMPNLQSGLLNAMDLFLSSVGNYVKGLGSGDWTHLPFMLHPLDTFDADISIYGVRHVAMNAPEMLLTRGKQGTSAPKPYPASVDPYVSRAIASWDLSIISTSTELDFDAMTLPSLTGEVNKRVIDLTADDIVGWASLFFHMHASSQGIGASSRSVPLAGGNGQRTSVRVQSQFFHYDMGGMPVSLLGFRCAR